MALSSSAPLHGRHRDKNGQISKKHGNTLIGTLRQSYEHHFAQGCDNQEKLSSVLQTQDEPSLRQLIRDTPGAESEKESL